MRLSIVTMYNSYATGARALGAYLNRVGHEARLIHMKAHNSPLISRRNSELLRAIREKDPLQGTIFREEGDQICPFHRPITEREKELFLEQLNRNRPDVLGFSVLWSEYETFKELSRLVRRHMPEIPILAGGPSAVTAPEYVAPYADVVCVGEGEMAVAEWLEDPERTDVPGLWFRKGEDVIKNPRRPLIEDLDSLPFPMYGENETLIEFDSTFEPYPADAEALSELRLPMSGRGCLFRCTYCVEGRIAELCPRRGKPARRSVDHFISELKEAKRRSPVKVFHFWDPIFVWDKPWLEEFAEKYPKRVGVPFDCFAHPLPATHRMLELVKKAGCSHIWLGVQSLSEHTLKRFYGRPMHPESVTRAVENAYRVGLGLVACDFIANSPYETEEGLARIFEFLIGTSKPVNVTFMPLVRYPEIPLARMDPPAESPSEAAHLFWNALSLLTQFRDIDRRGLRAISIDPDLKNNPDIVDEFLALYVRRSRYFGKSIHLEYDLPKPHRQELGRWPRIRLLAQRRLPHWYARAMLRKKKRRENRVRNLP